MPKICPLNMDMFKPRSDRRLKKKNSFFRFMRGLVGKNIIATCGSRVQTLLVARFLIPIPLFSEKHAATNEETKRRETRLKA
jgi:hypothetical protein